MMHIMVSTFSSISATVSMRGYNEVALMHLKGWATPPVLTGSLVAQGPLIARAYERASTVQIVPKVPESEHPSLKIRLHEVAQALGTCSGKYVQ